MLKSLPCDFEKLKKASVICAHTVWLPKSSSQVLQQPSRKNPVTGSVPQGCNTPPRTFFAFSDISKILLGLLVSIKPQLKKPYTLGP